MAENIFKISPFCAKLNPMRQVKTIFSSIVKDFIKKMKDFALGGIE
jgi:hypothetical protein